MQKDQYIRLTKLRKSQRCGKLPDSEILLHFALGEPTFIDEKEFYEGRLLEDIEIGGRICLLITNAAGRETVVTFRSEEVLDIEEDVVLLKNGFYRVTTGFPQQPALIVVLPEPQREHSASEVVSLLLRPCLMDTYSNGRLNPPFDHFPQLFGR